MKRMTFVMLAATAIGCASVGRAAFREPVVSYKDAVITGLGLTGGSLEVVLSIYNPNSFRLDGTALTYRIAVDSVPFGNGTLSDRFTVQEGDSTTVRLPLSFNYSGVGQAGRQFLLGNQFALEVLLLRQLRRHHFHRRKFVRHNQHLSQDAHRAKPQPNQEMLQHDPNRLPFVRRRQAKTTALSLARQGGRGLRLRHRDIGPQFLDDGRDVFQGA